MNSFRQQMRLGGFAGSGIDRERNGLRAGDFIQRFDETFHHAVLLSLGQFREDRQRDHFAACGFRLWH